MVGYCGVQPETPINFIFDSKKLGAAVREQITQAVVAEFGARSAVSSVPSPELIQQYLDSREDEDEEYDEAD